MADGSLYSKQQRLNDPNRKNPRKFYNHFMFKAIIVAFFVVIVPLFPSEPPDFVSPTVFNRSWELFHLIFVGIAVSYGLFSRKNDADDDDDKDSEVETAAKIDTAQSYMSRLLHVTSAFDGDEVEGGSDDHNVKKVETWSSQYIRNEPMLVVAEKSCVLDKISNSGINNGEKPLLLPVRSLKSRVCDDKDGRDDFGGSRVYARSNTSPGFSGNSRRLSSNDLIGLVHGEDSGVNSRGHGRSHSSLGVKGFPGDPRGISRNGSVKPRVGVSSEIGSATDGDGAVLRPLSRSNSGLSSRGFPSLSRRHSCGEYGEFGDGRIGVEERGEKIEESAVLPSPIPWRSRSGRLELKVESNDGSTMEHVLPPSLEESEAARLIKPQLSRSSSLSSPPNNLSLPPNVPSPRKLSSSVTLSAESQAKTVEDYGRRKSNYSSHVPPPPPPPPPPFPTTNRSRLVKSRSNRNEEVSSSHKELKRTVQSEPKDLGWQNTDESFSSANEGIEIRNEADNCASVGKSVRTVRPGESRTREVESPEIELPDSNSAAYSPMTKTSFSEFPKETRDFLEQVLLETDDESESEGENYREERVETAKVDEAPSEIVNDEGPDVDKKADEFIAKFREQIRLQRIESIKKSTGQLNRSSAR